MVAHKKIAIMRLQEVVYLLCRDAMGDLLSVRSVATALST